MMMKLHLNHKSHVKGPLCYMCFYFYNTVICEIAVPSNVYKMYKTIC